MFDIQAIDFKKLTNIKNQNDLEIEIYLYKGITKIYKILYNDRSIGIILFGEFFNGVLIEYFEIFKKERHKKIGREFILTLLKKLNTNIYLVSLPEKVDFWKECGFDKCIGNDSMLCYKPSTQ